MNGLKLSSIALALLLAHPLVQAENLSLRVTYSEGRNGIVFAPAHAQTGDFAVTPKREDSAGVHWRLVARNSKGAIVYETAVQNGLEFHAEGFDPKTGKIEESRTVRMSSGVFEVALPYGAEVASVEVLPPAKGAQGLSSAAAAADNAPLARFDRAALTRALSTTRAARTGMMTLASTPTATKLIETGPSGQRMDYVLVGDGYTAADMDKWHADADRIVAGILADPLFNARRAAFNFIRVDVASNESGTDESDLGIYRDTAFDGAFFCGGVERSICVDESKVLAAVGAVTAPDARDAILVVTNSSRYGGAAAGVARLSAGPHAPETALHELGHTPFGLADEYEEGPCTATNEPSQRDVTRELSRTQGKWGHMIAASTPVPTWPNTVPNGTVGMFQGGNYCTNGIYRPTENSRMRNLYQPWHAVNEMLISARIDAYLLYKSCPNASYVYNATSPLGHPVCNKVDSRDSINWCSLKPWAGETYTMAQTGWTVLGTACRSLARMTVWNVFVAPKP